MIEVKLDVEVLTPSATLGGGIRAAALAAPGGQSTPYAPVTGMPSSSR